MQTENIAKNYLFEFSIFHKLYYFFDIKTIWLQVLSQCCPDFENFKTVGFGHIWCALRRGGFSDSPVNG